MMIRYIDDIKISKFTISNGIVTVITDKYKTSVSHNKIGHLYTLTNENPELNAEIILRLIGELGGSIK